MTDNCVLPMALAKPLPATSDDSLSLSVGDVTVDLTYATGPYNVSRADLETMMVGMVAEECIETDSKYSALLRQTDTGIMSGNLEASQFDL